jgi:hypothetical protein
MDALKLAALDEKDLEVISACAQDSVIKTGEIQYQAKGNRLVLPLNRFVWEREPRAKGQGAERRRAFRPGHRREVHRARPVKAGNCAFAPCAALSSRRSAIRQT